MELKIQVLMLAENRDFVKNDIVQYKGSSSLNIIDYDKRPLTSSPTDANFIPQQVYFLDNYQGWRERLKEDDTFIFFDKNNGPEFHKFHLDIGYGIKTKTFYDDKDGSSLVVSGGFSSGKIIATTNTILDLPLIPEFFVRDFVLLNGRIDNATIQYISKQRIINVIKYEVINKSQ